METVVVAEVVWPASAGGEPGGWAQLEGLTLRASGHLQKAGGYLERCDGEGAVFVFGCWGRGVDTKAVVAALWDWVKEAGGSAGLTVGECVSGVGHFPDQRRWTVTGTPLRRARRLAAAARSYAAGLLIEEPMLPEVAGFWRTRRMAWWDFEGERVLLHEITGPAQKAPFGAADDLRRWNMAWECFWAGRWVEAESGFATLVREKNDPAARVFALRSQMARRSASAA